MNPTEQASSLPSVLTSWVVSGAMSLEVAEQIERFRSTTGRSLTAALSEFGYGSLLEEEAPGGDLRPLLVGSVAEGWTFARFVESDANALACALAWAVATGELQPPGVSPLVLVGPDGVGKSHLLAALVHEARSRHGEGDALCLNAVDLEVEVERAERLGARAELRKWLQRHRVVAIDDVQRVAGKPGLRDELASLMAAAERGELWLLIAADRPAIAEDEELSAVLTGALVAPMALGDGACRRAIVELLAEDDPLESEVVDYLASVVDDSARRLRGAVAQLQTTRRLLQQEITVEVARAIVPLAEDLRPAGQSPLREVSGDEHEEKVRGPSAVTLVSEPAEVQGGPAVDSEETTSGPPLAPSWVNDDEPPRSPGITPDTFRAMVASAENEQEQALALEIALMERLRLLRAEEKSVGMAQTEQALALLRAGSLNEALALVAS